MNGQPSPPVIHDRPRPEFRLVAFYLVVVAVWMSVTARLAASDTRMWLISGAIFTTITAILLFRILRRAFAGWREAERLRIEAMEEARSRIRYLSSHVQSLREEDRTRISREIHDELGQWLTGVKVELRMLENRLTEREDRTLNPQIDKLVEVGELVDATISSVQRIAAGLRPALLDHLGLATALMEEAGLFSKRTGIPCNLTFEDFEIDLPADFSTATFRIFQEALTNVARHAEASEVVSTCAIRNDQLALTIRDNGKGMDPAVFENPKTLGLMGMIERAESVGGQVTLKSRPRHGTEVVFSAPVPEQEILPSPESAAPLSS